MHSVCSEYTGSIMNKKSRLLPWKRMALEGGVIVLSILLAFAIDAWWNHRKERIEGIEQLSHVAAELRLNSDMVRSKIEILQIAIDAASQFLSWMGPEPLEKDSESVAHQLNVLSEIGTFSLVRRAADDYLAAGRESTSRDTLIRESLSEWYFFGDRLENQYTILRTEHWTLNDYLNRIPVAPALVISKANPVMAKHPVSKFPFDQFVVALSLKQQEIQTNLLDAIVAIVPD